MKAVNVNETREFVSKYETDKDNPTVFVLGVIDHDMKASIMDSITEFSLSSQNADDKARQTIKINERNLKLVKYGLRDVKNLIDPEAGSPVAFATDVMNHGRKQYTVVSDSVMRRIPFEVINELAEQIISDAGLSGNEEKN